MPERLEDYEEAQEKPAPIIKGVREAKWDKWDWQFPCICRMGKPVPTYFEQEKGKGLNRN